MRTLQHKTIWILLAIVLIAGCRKSGNKASWDIDALVPLLYSELTISNIIPDSLLSIGPDGFVTLAYADTILRLSLDTLVKLPDTTITEIFSLPVLELTVPAGTTVSSIPEEIEISAQGIELKNAEVKSGTIIIKITSTIPGNMVVKYEIPHATLNGVSFETQALVPAASGGSPGQITQSFDVSGYALDFTQGASSPFNRLKTLLTIGTDPNGGSTLISFTNSVTIEITFAEFTPKFARGYFGNQSYDIGPETTAFNAFNLVENGTIDIEDVQFNLLIRNGVGADVRATIQQLSSENTTIGSSIGLQHAVIGSPINLNRALYLNNQIHYTEYPILMNNNNSNIDLMLENLPNQFGYTANLQLNPLGNISNHNDFIDCESTFDVVLDAAIPLSLIATQLQLGDTSAITINQNDALDGVNSGTLIIRMNNGFPLEGWIEFASLKNNERTFTFMEDAYFPSATLDANNQVIAPIYREFRIEMNTEDIAALKSSDKLVARVRFNTASLTEHIKIYDHHRMTLKAIGDFNYHVETK